MDNDPWCGFNPTKEEKIQLIKGLERFIDFKRKKLGNIKQDPELRKHQERTGLLQKRQKELNESCTLLKDAKADMPAKTK